MLKVAAFLAERKAPRASGSCPRSCVLEARVPRLRRPTAQRTRVLRGLAGSFKIGIRAWLKGDGDDLSHVGALPAASAIDTSIGFKVALDAAVVIHDEVRILPVSA